MLRLLLSTHVTAAALALCAPAKRFACHQGASITSLDFDDLGHYLILAGVDRSIQLYDVHKGTHHKEVQSQKYGAHVARFTHSEFSCLYASTPAAGLDVDHLIRHLLLTTKAYLRYFKGHRAQVVLLEVNPVSDTFLLAALDRTAKLWDLRCQQPAGNLDVGGPAAVAYDPHGVVFAVTGGHDRSVRLYDVRSFDRAPLAAGFLPQGAPITRAEFSNTGRLLLVSTAGEEYHVVDAFLALVLSAIAAPGLQTDYAYAHTGLACFTPCGRFVLRGVMGPEPAVTVYDAASVKSSDGALAVPPGANPARLRPVLELQAPHGLPKLVAFNPRLLTFATADAAVVLWAPKESEVGR